MSLSLSSVLIPLVSLPWSSSKTWFVAFRLVLFFERWWRCEGHGIWLHPLLYLWGAFLAWKVGSWLICLPVLRLSLIGFFDLHSSWLSYFTSMCVDISVITHRLVRHWTINNHNSLPHLILSPFILLNRPISL